MNTAASAFDTVPETNHLGLLGKHPDPRRIVQFLSFKKDDVARVAGVSKESVRYDAKIPSDVLERLTEIASICEFVAQHFGGDPRRTALWFKLPNPLLGNIAPRDMIRLGRYHKVLALVLEARQATERAPSS